MTGSVDFQRVLNTRFKLGINERTPIFYMYIRFDIVVMNESAKRVISESYLIKALHPMQVSCFLANFMIPLFDGVEMEIDRM